MHPRSLIFSTVALLAASCGPPGYVFLDIIMAGGGTDAGSNTAIEEIPDSEVAAVRTLRLEVSGLEQGVQTYSFDGAAGGRLATAAFRTRAKGEGVLNFTVVHSMMRCQRPSLSDVEH